MSFTQEFCNALSMFIPTLVIIFYGVYDPGPMDGKPFWNVFSRAFAFGTFIHLPFSIAYHLLCAYDFFEDRVNCVPRKLDQTLIHVVCFIYSYALSGIALYGCGCGVINLWCVWGGEGGIKETISRATVPPSQRTENKRLGSTRTYFFSDSLFFFM